MEATPYQVMPALSADEYAALKADIAARGVQVPVEYDDRGNILDGHHRVQICGELGIIHWPRLVRYGLSEEEKRRHARRLNLDRRHLDQQQRRALIEDELRERPEASDRLIASGLGVDHKTVSKARSDLESTGEIPQLETRQGRDQRKRRIVQFVPSTPEEEKGISISARAIRAREQERKVGIVRALRDMKAPQGGTIDDLHAAIGKGFRASTILADPPWKFLTRSALGEDRSACTHYKTDAWDQILSLPVGQIAAPNCALFMWIVDWIPPSAIDEVLGAWGFVYKTVAFTWAKQNQSGDGWHMGMGYWTRCLAGSTEVHIFDLTDHQVKKVNLASLRSRAVATYLIWSHTGWRRVFDFVECGNTKVFKINTRIGSAISSLTHRWAVKRLRSTGRSKASGKRTRRHVVEYETLGEIDKLRSAKTAQSGKASINFTFSTQPIEHPFATKECNGFELSEDIGWLIGLFCAEGNFGRGSHSSQVRFSLHRKETAIAARIESIIDQLNLSGDRYRKRKIKAHRHFLKVSAGLAVYFSSVKIKILIRQFVHGDGAHGKRLSMDRLLQTPVAFRTGLLNGMLAGDGTKGAHGYAGYRNLRLCNAGLIEDFSELARGLGIMTSALTPKISRSLLAGDRRNYGLRFVSPRNKALTLEDRRVLPIEIRDVQAVGTDSTYDIWVEGHAFVANWMISHNSNPEQCILATKGSPKRLAADVRQLVVAPVMEHSRKPDEVHDRIERLVGGPYLELYARRSRENWVTWGNELQWQQPSIGEPVGSVPLVRSGGGEPESDPGLQAGSPMDDSELDIPNCIKRDANNRAPFHQQSSDEKPA